jgi:transposase
MLTLPSSVRVYLAAEPVDLRRGHDGLVAIVRSTWRLDPFGGHLFVFLGRRFGIGTALSFTTSDYRKGAFGCRKIASGAAHVQMDATTLAMLLDGIDVKYVRRPATWPPPVATTPSI